MKHAPNSILLVEDDPASRKLVRAVLQAGGYQIDEAESLNQARAYLARRAPALVLLDMRLHGGDGLELARELRANARYDSLPIIAVTAQALKGDERRILDAGCDLYLSKPIDTRQLRAVVERLIERGRSHVG